MQRARYRRIVFFFARVLFSFAIWDLVLPRLGGRAWARRTRPGRLKRSAIAYRALAIQMGGVLIKVGQFLSTRVDVLPVEVTNELAGLQDEVPPVEFEEISLVAEAEYGVPLTERFSQFDPQPMAAASLGQVHRAVLSTPSNGTGQAQIDSNVVVKIQRPHIEEIITIDLAALRTVGKWLVRYRPISRRVDLPALLAEFSRILYQEIDYLAEGRNAETFASNFRGYPGVRVPHVVWSHTTRRVLTLENVLAIKITDYDSISAAGVSRAEVASRLLDTYLKQIFEDGFFHADPHPGNLFVSPLTDAAEDEEVEWQLTFVDFGMVGRVPSNLRQGLREMLIGVGTQDAGRVVRSYQTLGVLLPSADLSLLEKAEARMFDRFWGKTMNELRNTSVEEVLEFSREFRQLLYDLPFQVPHDLIFLGRAVSILSGMCTGLDPDFNLWDHLAPYAQKLISDEIKAGRADWWAEVQNQARLLLSLPHKLDAALTRLERGEVNVHAPEISHQVSRLEIVLQQLVASVLFASLLLGSIQLYLADRTLLAGLLSLIDGAILIYILLLGRRHRSG
jgi:predicted unusual protein kinase regulating ubiquinone biosynthesis (AarF/ABC1/UbiB family)